MVYEDLLVAIGQCDAHLLPFNLGNRESFLFNGKWYPALAIVRTAADIANDPTVYNTYRAVTKITELLPMSIIAIINYQHPQPIELDAEAKLIQLRLYQKALNYIIGNN